ncbi:heavy metal sensor histidine kinase [Orbaceae bacterium ESL0721]|nr:heavy metal sensor histidine kinase [Orbaceae bacterium ESL0721]
MKQNRRFLVRFPIIICLFTCGLLYSLSQLIERSFEEFSIQQNISELNSVIHSIESEITYFYPIDNREEFLQNLLIILARHQRLFVYIIDDTGKVIYRTRGPILTIAQSQINLDQIMQDHTSTIWETSRSSYRIAASKLVIDDKHQFTTIVAINRDLQLEFIKRLHDGLRLLIILSCIIALLATLTTIYFTQKPINLLIKKIEKINWKNLNSRISTTSVPPKYASLVKAFNNMLHRMEDTFRRQQNFTADIAHEMRTPITNLTTQTEIALNSARTTNEYREILYSNLEEYSRLSQMITDMLFLAQADNKQLIPNLIMIDLHQFMIDFIDYFEPLSEEKNITIKLLGDCKPIQGDRNMISRAVSNILSNAIRHTPINGQITIELDQLSANWVKIVIANPGKKIDEFHLDHLFDRFYRVDESRQRNGEGAGIGLAIVKTIIEAHKGLIYVLSDEHHTRFIIELPTNIQNIGTKETK